MEKVKLIKETHLDALESKINSFMAGLDESTDIIDVRIDEKFFNEVSFASIYPECQPDITEKRYYLVIIRYRIYTKEVNDKHYRAYEGIVGYDE